MDYDLEIEFEKAEQSIEYDRGLAAHYKTSADEKQRLLDLARHEHANARYNQRLLEASQSENIRLRLENQRLQARIAELEARPTTIHADQYVGEQHVTQQLVRNQLVNGTPRKRIAKNKHIDLSNQLNLWPSTTISL